MTIEKHVVSLGFGNFKVLRGQQLNRLPLSKDVAVRLASQEITPQEADAMIHIQRLESKHQESVEELARLERERDALALAATSDGHSLNRHRQLCKKVADAKADLDLLDAAMADARRLAEAQRAETADAERAAQAVELQASGAELVAVGVELDAALVVFKQSLDQFMAALEKCRQGGRNGPSMLMVRHIVERCWAARMHGSPVLHSLRGPTSDKSLSFAGAARNWASMCANSGEKQ